MTRTRRRPGRPSGGVPVVDRERVLDAAETVIRREGATASIEAIAAAAGVTKPMVYARVGSRTDLANALAQRLTARLVQAAGSAIADADDGREALVGMIREALLAVEADRELFVYVTSGSEPTDRLSLATLSVDPMAQQLRAWGDEHDLTPETAEAWAWATVGMINFTALWWITERDRSAATLAEQLADLLWSGLSGR